MESCLIQLDGFFIVELFEVYLFICRSISDFFQATTVKRLNS